MSNRVLRVDRNLLIRFQQLISKKPTRICKINEKNHNTFLRSVTIFVTLKEMTPSKYANISQLELLYREKDKQHFTVWCGCFLLVVKTVS